MPTWDECAASKVVCCFQLIKFMHPFSFSWSIENDYAMLYCCTTSFHKPGQLLHAVVDNMMKHTTKMLDKMWYSICTDLFRAPRS